MDFWASVIKVAQTASKVLPPCHVCGELGAQLCKECQKMACHRHAYTNFNALSSICSDCLGKHFAWVAADVRTPLPEDWPYQEAPWEILGIRQNASEDEIKQAQRKLSKEFHPDHGGDVSRQMAVNAAANFMLDNR